MKSVVCHEPLMPQGRYLFCFAKKGDPDIRPMRNGCEICSENVARSETRCAQTTDRFIDGFTPNLGDECTGTLEPKLDRCAMRTTGARMRASGLRAFHPFFFRTSVRPKQGRQLPYVYRNA